MVAEKMEPRAPRGGRPPHAANAVRLSEIVEDGDGRLHLPIEEFARVLGGGIVPGSLVLVGGDPGIGKSTLLLQVALSLADRRPVLYVSGEESTRQIKGRALRLTTSQPEDLYLMAETDLETILGQIESLQPNLVVIDSIQTMTSPDLDPGAGSITQVRACAARLQALAKASGIPIFLIGHVTKEGSIAGPKVLEHLVDTVLYLEGDSQHAFRLLRSVKNRFGPTTEVGVFEMRGDGMIEVPNPSEAFLAERVVQAPGSVVGVTLEGTRPLLVEFQGLTSPTAFGNPRRTANGVDFNRLLLITAVLTRRLGERLADQDVFLNVVGGLRIEEPAADLAIAAALAS
jgi:DNA repair protein RadA/Sms